MQLPDANGFEIHEMLARAAEVLPVVFVTGHGDIPMSVRAIKAGAVDFLTKPVPGETCCSPPSPRRIARDEEERAARAHAREVQARYERLTPREREVFAHLISGQLNKQVAFDLGTTERTIKAHRHSIMKSWKPDRSPIWFRIAAVLHIAPVRGDS